MLEQIWKNILRRETVPLWAIPAFILWLFSFVYRLLLLLRPLLNEKQIKLNIPVISVGNLTVGGTGKTPIVEFIASVLSDQGYKVGIVSSGYGRKEIEPIIMEGFKLAKCSPDLVGDEMKLLALSLPGVFFSIDEKKSVAALNLESKGLVDLIIVDDGFQHLSLKRDFNLVTFDSTIPRKLLKLFPFGVLREPIKSIIRADSVILTRTNFSNDTEEQIEYLKKYNLNADYYRARFISTDLIGITKTVPDKILSGKTVFLFAGIGNFGAFKKQVSRISSKIDYALELSDHQDYDDQLLGKIKKLAQEYDSDIIITTGKDWVKLRNFDFGREIYYLGQSIDLDPGEEQFILKLKNRLNLSKTK